jgi:hypothetical protein
MLSPSLSMELLVPGVVVAALALCRTRITHAHNVRVSGKAHQLKTTRHEEEQEGARAKSNAQEENSHVQQEQLQRPAEERK